MVRRDVIGHEIKNQSQAARLKGDARRGQSVTPAEMWVDHIVAYRVGRSDHVSRNKIGKSRFVFADQLGDAAGYCLARGAPGPDAHQPNGVESELADVIPFRRRDVT